MQSMDINDISIVNLFLYIRHILCWFYYICRAGILNSKFEYGVEKKVSKLNTLAATVQIDSINGVILKIK